MTVRTFLVRGLIAGFVAGLLAFAVAHTVGEPPVDASIKIEEQGPAAAAEHDHEAGTSEHSHDEEEAVVSRANQSTWGLLTATVVLGAVFGGLVGLVSAFATGRLGRLRPAATSALVAAIGFGAYYLVPYLKYPPNPPAVGSPDTIGQRTAEYLTMVVISVVAAVAAVALARTLIARHGGFVGSVVPALGFGVVVVLAGVLLPSIDEVPRTFPADTLWQFRLASLTTQATLWATIGVVLAGLLGRAHAAEEAKRERRALVGTAR